MTWNVINMYVFDVDGVITKSKQPINEKMVVALSEIMEREPIALISGASEKRFKTQILPYFKNIQNLHCYPTNGSDRIIPLKDFNLIKEDLIKMSSELCYLESSVFGEIVEYRINQITFSALGQEAPLNLKEEWDKSKVKRKQIIDKITPLYPKYDFLIGGKTSIDVVPKGINKAYGIKRIMRDFNIKKEEIIYFGDDLEPNGNDYPVMEMGVKCISVSSPEDTLSYLSLYQKVIR